MGYKNCWKNKSPAEGMENKEMGDVGNFEIQTESLEIINKAETLPIPINSIGYEIGEDIRMKYRYLDLRRSRLQKFKDARKILFAIFIGKRIWEIETPILGKSTPEGARDYLVPSRLHLGNFTLCRNRLSNTSSF